MKTISSLLLASVFAGAQAIAAPPVRTPVPITHVYSPLGFDSNDNTEIVVEGYLPNLCYKAATARASVVGKQIEVEVSALKNQPGGNCAQMIVPFLESASVGVLDKGSYSIEAGRGTPWQAQSTIGITESTSPAVDDFVYANVQGIERVEGTRKVLLKGENPSPCFTLERIEWVSNGTDTFSVLPVMRQVSESCPTVMVPFSYETEVPRTLTRNSVLLHVRVMNGKSVNALFID